MNTNGSISMQPKRRFKRDAAAERGGGEDLRAPAPVKSPLSRKPRMKRSGRPHQRWAAPPKPSDLDLKLPAGATLHELLGLFTNAYLRPLYSRYLS